MYLENLAAVLILSLWIKSNLAGDGEMHYFNPTDFQQPGFDFEILELVSEATEKSSSCDGVNNIIKSYRYPVWFEGRRQNVTISTVGVMSEKRVEKIYAPPQPDQSEPTLLGERIIQPHLNCKQQDDPELIKILKVEYLDPPSRLPYNFKSEDLPYGDGQPIMVDQRYFQEDVKGGFFIESGAADGERDSTTLYFELKHGWTGLLVEPMLNEYKALQTVNRKAWTSSTCLSPKPTPTNVQFSTAQSSNLTVFGIVENAQDADTIELQCFPLSSLILALGNPRVDFLSLDIEGTEFQVLENMLWDKIDIRAISVETQFLEEFGFTHSALTSLLERQGFVFLDRIARDSVYVQSPRPDLVQVKAHLPTHSRKISAREILMRRQTFTRIRMCYFFRVPVPRLQEHCKTNYPLDYYRRTQLRNIPDCLKKAQCSGRFLDLVETLRYAGPWLNFLSDGCRVFTYDS